MRSSNNSTAAGDIFRRDTLVPLRKSGQGNPSNKFFDLPPVFFQNNRLSILDQTQLPQKIVYQNLKNYRAVIKAIKTLQVRGAPLIGVTAAFGLALEAQKYARSNTKSLRQHLQKVAEKLRQARPTAVNLTWAIKRCQKRIETTPDDQLSEAVLDEAQKIYQEEERNSLTIGKIGAKLLKRNSCLLTICNTGKLAAPGLGTALSVIYTAQQQGKNPLVYVCETRPLLQGARLTIFELQQAGISTILITDAMASTIAASVDLFLVGADRIAANGDTANKIGTLTLAIIASYYQKPFYVVAPCSTFDLTKPNGAAIPIELRNEQEVITIQGKRIAPKNTCAYNPAFDITPNQLITAFITERGIIHPPFRQNIKKAILR